MSNLFTSKKGLGLLIVVGISLLIATLIMLISTSNGKAIEGTAGQKQYDLIITNENLELAQIYLDDSLDYSSYYAGDKLFRTSGIEVDGESTGRYFLSPCRSHIYPLYNNKYFECLPTFRSTYKSYIKQTIDGYAESYSLTPLETAYTVDISGSAIQLTTPEPQKVSIASRNEFTGREKIAPRGKLGSYGAELETKCDSGECFAQLVEYYHELYDSSGFNFNYVYGGESPYTYDLTIADQENNPDSIFKDADITKVQPGFSLLSEPGFDSAGWLWWVARHAQIPQLYEPKEIRVQYRDISDEETICKKDSSTPCDQSTILTQAQRGDLLFIKEEVKRERPGVTAITEEITHVMIYLGDNKVSHSRKGKGLVIEDIPLSYLTPQTSKIYEVIRIDFDYAKTDENKPLFGHAEGEEATTTQADCLIPIDFSQINEEAFRDARANIAKEPYKHLAQFEQAIVKTQQQDTILKASNDFPKTPTSLIKSIMFTEIYAVGQTEKYLSGSIQYDADKNIVGPMQTGKSACNDVNRKTREQTCDFDLIKKGGYEGAANGIISGTAYLDVLPELTSGLNDQKLNYYFLALAYNAGGGSLNKILKAASLRTKIPKEDLQWRDITKEDVATGTGWGKAKVEEVFEYPNFVAYMLSLQCDGDDFASYRTYDSTMDFSPVSTSSVKVNLNALNKINTFIEEVRTCKSDEVYNELESCVVKKIESFNDDNKDIIKIIHKENENSAALEVADQLLNCYYNDQTNCTCLLDTEKLDTTSFAENKNAILLKDSGRVDFGTHGSTDTGFNVEETITYLPFTPNRIETNLEATDDISIDYNKKTNKLSLRKMNNWGSDEFFNLDEDMDAFAIAKRGEFSVEAIQANEQQKQLVEYAKLYLGTGYGGIGSCTAQKAQSGACTTQCGSFSSNAFRYGLGLSGNDVPATNYGKDKCKHETMRILEKNEPLQPGDLFASSGTSQAGQIAGHTGMYVGKGMLSEPSAKKRSDGKPYCYMNFVEDPTGEDVFIHSTGPVCYNTLAQLTTSYVQGGQGRTIYSFCRHELLEGADNEQDETPLQWMMYQEETDAVNQCRNNKHYFRFQAEVQSSKRIINFSLYLEDTKEPQQLERVHSNNRQCSGEEIGIFEWSVDDGEEAIFSFDIEVEDPSGKKETFTLNESGAILTDVTDSSKLNIVHQLYKKQDTGKITYYYLINSFDDDLLRPGTTYQFRVTPMDHYLNKAKASTKTPLRIPQRDPAQAIPLVSVATDSIGRVVNIVNSFSEGSQEGIEELSSGQAIGGLFETFTDASGGFIGGLFSYGECKDKFQLMDPFEEFQEVLI